jgi:iron(III) transport system substrate-binding protein
VVAAARQEGSLIVSAGPSESWRTVLTSFESDYPGIKVEYVGLNSRDFYPRLNREREADQHLWDIRIGGVAVDTYQAKASGALDPVRPVLMLPEVTQAPWLGGFDGIFLDAERRYLPAFLAYESRDAFVNRDFVPQSDLPSNSQLLDTRWDGRIVLQDPRGGQGLGATLHFLLLYGEDFVRDLYAKPGLIVTGDLRQQAEWVVRGRYPIGVGVNEEELRVFQREGLGTNVTPLPGAKNSMTTGFGAIQLINRRPHPNAATVFSNWLLTQPMQERLTQTVHGVNSRRLDVRAGTPEITVDPAKLDQYVERNREEYLPYWTKATEFARTLPH